MKWNQAKYLILAGICLGLTASSPVLSYAEDAASSQSSTAPDSYHAAVSASAGDTSTVMVTVSGDNAAVDVLSVTLPGQSSQTLDMSGTDGNGCAVFSFTASAQQQNGTVPYIPGLRTDGGIVWYEALAGSFTIPQVIADTPADEPAEGAGEGTETEASDDGAETEVSGEGEVTDGSAGENEAGSTAVETEANSSTAEDSASDTSAESVSSSSDSSSTSSSSSSKKRSKKTSGSASNSSSGASGGIKGTSSSGSTGSSQKSASSGRASTGKKSGSSRSGSGSKSRSEDESEGSDSAMQVTEVQSSLAGRLLENGETLVYELEEAPSLDGLTYEATWEDAQTGISIYLYEEGSAVLEISPARQSSGRKETQTAGEDAESEESSSDLRFLLLPEQTQSLALDSLLESWQQDPDSVQTKTSSD